MRKVPLNIDSLQKDPFESEGPKHVEIELEETEERVHEVLVLGHLPLPKTQARSDKLGE